MSDVTQILSAIEAGDPTAADELLPLVYGELRKLAAAKTSGARELITEDFSHGQDYGRVRAINPFREIS